MYSTPWRKTLDATYFSSYTGAKEIVISEDQECPKQFVFTTDSGFKAITGKFKITNFSEHPVIFSQTKIDQSNDFESLTHLLNNLEISCDSGEVYYNPIDGKIKLIANSSGVIDMENKVEKIVGLTWNEDYNFEVESDTIFSGDIKIINGRAIEVLASVTSSITIKIDGHIDGDLIIKNNSNQLIKIRDQNDNLLVQMMSQDSCSFYSKKSTSENETVILFDVTKSICYLGEFVSSSDIENEILGVNAESPE